MGHIRSITRPKNGSLLLYRNHPLAYRAGDLERAGRGEHREEKTQISGVLERADRVEKDNEAMAEERDGLIERIKERIEGIYQELQALPEKIREAGERVKQWEYKRELFSAPSFAELARKYSHAKGPQISTTPRSTQPTRGPERDVGPSRQWRVSTRRSKKRGASMRKRSSCKKRCWPATGT